MGTLNEKLDYLKETKSQIKEAIISKGQEVSSSDTFRSYASKISAINTVNNEDLTVNPMTSVQTFTPTQGHTGFGEVNVNAVTSAIDSNIQAGNIKQGVEILGVTGEYEGTQINNQDKTITTNGTYTADSGYTGLGEVTVNLPLDSKTITVNGTYNASSDELEGYSSVTVNVADVPAVVKELNVTPTISSQTIRPEEGVDGFSVVNVSAVTSSIDGNILAGNIKKDVQILGVTGSYEGASINNQNKSITSDGSYTADVGYTGLGTVTVTAGAVASAATQNEIAEELMLINDGATTFTLTVSPTDATPVITSTTNSVVLTPTSSSDGVSVYSISVDALKTYSYSVSKEGYVTSTGTINGGTASLTVTLVAES